MLEILKAQLDKNSRMAIVYSKEFTLPSMGEGLKEEVEGSKGSFKPKWEVHDYLREKLLGLREYMTMVCGFPTEKLKNWHVTGYEYYEATEGRDRDYRLIGYKESALGFPIKIVSPMVFGELEAMSVSRTLIDEFEKVIDALDVEVRKYMEGKKYRARQMDLFNNDDDHDFQESPDTIEISEEQLANLTGKMAVNH